MIEILPSSFGGLSNLEVLNLWCCENLILLPDSFGSLRNLRTLTLGRTKIGIYLNRLESLTTCKSWTFTTVLV
ncbi:hypothetical protein KC19_6G054900 [Ceratodon purpureus]|uniref:Uncharacterized protein n=1 Tax=Ceratodon purpureus TaxID=3225 RepID=A0A8T0HAT0_CERPU|nr:hypothetical protein KC19_6G054900 [Ceratodon purpureus]